MRDPVKRDPRKIASFLIFIILLVVYLYFFIFNKQELAVSREIAGTSDNSGRESQMQKINSTSFLYEITGAVNKPGVYSSLPAEKTVIAAIEEAGGFRDDADLTYVHKYIRLSVPVQKEQKIFIPSLNEAIADNRLNLNSATRDELIDLNGVGEATADLLIQNRPFAVIEDIDNIKGLRKDIAEKIKSQAVVF
jgi:competence protein ComEA